MKHIKTQHRHINNIESYIFTSGGTLNSVVMRQIDPITHLGCVLNTFTAYYRYVFKWCVFFFFHRNNLFFKLNMPNVQLWLCKSSSWHFNL